MAVLVQDRAWRKKSRLLLEPDHRLSSLIRLAQTQYGILGKPTTE